MSTVTNVIEADVRGDAGESGGERVLQAEPRTSGSDSSVAAAKAGDMSAIVVRDAVELEQFAAAWEELAAAALEPNVFYEPWVLIEAFRALAAGRDIQFVLIFAPNPAWEHGPRVLCGVFPLERKRGYRGLPLRNLSLWKHKYCPLCTPIVRADRARETMLAFFDWLASAGHGCSVMEFRHIPGDGRFHQLLVDCFDQRARLSFVSNCFTRAVFKPAASADSYLGAALSAKHRKALLRKEKRLAESGGLEYQELKPDEDPRTWIEKFVELEASGWKGKEGTAVASSLEDRAFFEAVLQAAFRRRRLMMLALRHNGRAIAFKCTFIAGSGAFASKIAFDEQFAAFSPGLLLEMESIRRVHARPEIQWVDSCAAADSMMFNRLWLDRRIIQSIVIGTGKPAGDFFVSLLPLFKWLRRFLAGLVGRSSRPRDRIDLG
ncbi:MAG TPA: GNAT family N-acetyltransferase [Blastocatellia bacterium]|nr:GNAT family N-acetyltransferase [Blastocatellia bacterium]